MTDYDKLIYELRKTERICRDRMDGQVMLDAADAIEEMQEDNADLNQTITYLLETMKELQMPKRGEIVRCGECKHRNDLTPTKWHPCVDMAVNDDWFCADGEREVQQLWISVKDRLPERGTLVLCACRANIYEVLTFDGNGWIHDPMHDYMLGFVTHWMPLPELPKDGEHCG